MTTHPIRLAAVLLIAAFVAACDTPTKHPATQASPSASTNANPKPPENDRPAPAAASRLVPLAGDEHIGSDGDFNFTGLMLFQSAEDMARDGTRKLKRNNDGIDFKTQTLIVVAGGQQDIGDAWIQITSVHIDGDTVVVDVTMNKPAANAADPKSTAYASWIVNKIDPSITKTKLNIKWVSSQPRPEAPPAPPPMMN